MTDTVLVSKRDLKIALDKIDAFIARFGISAHTLSNPPELEKESSYKGHPR